MEIKSFLPNKTSIISWTAEWKFHIKSSRKNFKSTPSSLIFFSFGLWVDALKSEWNLKFQVLGRSGSLFFQLSRIGSLDQKMMQKWEQPLITRVQVLREVFTPNNPKNWTLKVLKAEESKNPTLRRDPFWDNFRTQKRCNYESELKAVVFFAKSKVRPFILFKGTFFSYIIWKNEHLNRQFFSVKNSKFSL